MSEFTKIVNEAEAKVEGIFTKVEHVVKADFDALVARVEALEAAVKKAV